MKIRNTLPQNIRNFMMTSKHYKPLYLYLRDGVYVMFGPLEGINLTKSYMEEPEKVLDFLDNILDSDNAPFKMKEDTREVMNDLLKNN
jgi:hypothetical protein